MSTDSNQIDQLKQIDQLLTEISSVYRQSGRNLGDPKETKDVYRKAFKLLDGIRREMEAAYGAIDIQQGVAADVPNVLAHLRAHKDWVTFLFILEGVVATELNGGSMYIYLAEGLLQEVDPDTAEMYSMQPRGREEDADITPLSDELDRGDVLHMPPLAGPAPQTSTPK